MGAKTGCNYDQRKHRTLCKCASIFWRSHDNKARFDYIKYDRNYGFGLCSHSLVKVGHTNTCLFPVRIVSDDPIIFPSVLSCRRSPQHEVRRNAVARRPRRGENRRRRPGESEASARRRLGLGVCVRVHINALPNRRLRPLVWTHLPTATQSLQQ